ncbi:Eco57I restriction-modification methylase domain-containing protein [Bremerella alba]|nr:DNA methyltransferase [Bremerella alba]
MLFAQFLAENHLLMHPDGVAVSLEECEELAASEGATNGFVLAARYASTMLPQVFRTDDVLLEIEFAPEHRLALEKLLASLPSETFLADDSLGWVYQFWQTKRKKKVNDSGEKIDGDTLPAVTQLFTEDYMVQFLLQNTIGAWWCAKEGITGPPGGAGIPPEQCPVEMPYLRWREDGSPAAGSFDGWPKTLAEFTMLDPCCGSGHFIVNGFNLLVPLRMHDEGLSASEACDAVLRDNLFGLELDPRCTQIAAFALALAAWRIRDESGEQLGYRVLPQPHIACSGQGVAGRKEEWLSLANGDSRLRNGMDKLYDLFQKAPHLGSLIDPRREAGDLFAAGFSELRPLLQAALSTERVGNDADKDAIGVAAMGIAASAHILSSTFNLIATNVPYLGFRDQAEVLRNRLESHHHDALADLATAFVERSLRLASKGGATALVTPQNWLFLKLYRDLRKKLLRDTSWRLVARLGPRAFDTISGEIVNVALVVLSLDPPTQSLDFVGIDVSHERTATLKSQSLQNTGAVSTPQLSLTKKADARVVLGETSHNESLGKYAHAYKGLGTGDDPRYRRNFWEMDHIPQGWVRLQSSVDSTMDFGGCEGVVWLDAMTNPIQPGVYLRGEETWGRRGVLVRLVGNLPCCLSVGEAFDQNVAVVMPNDPSILPAIWEFCKSQEFAPTVRSIDQALKVTNGTLDQVPFCMDDWIEAANENAVPEPHSSNPTQWLYDEVLPNSDCSLQVAVCTAVGYRWPCRQVAIDEQHGILCVPAVRGKKTAKDVVEMTIKSAFGDDWNTHTVGAMLASSGFGSNLSLSDWLQTRFFEDHIRVFENRPFVWHIWDGRKDGFSCLVNYHKLNYKMLENLTYSYLGDWLKAQEGDAKSGKAGSDLRLAAAKELQAKLKLILDGEPPYDIFVRWKPLHEQAIGWNPDFNDGVRVNIRPFVEAGILRKTPNIKWTKDRGKEPERTKDEFPWFWDGNTPKGERVNDVHLTNAEKQAAREAKGVA